MPRGDLRRGIAVTVPSAPGESWKERAERLQTEVDILTVANDELEQTCSDLESRLEEIRAIAAPDPAGRELWLTQAINLLLIAHARSNPDLKEQVQELLKGQPINADVRTDAAAEEHPNGVD
jgi:hypothetical protein